MTAVLSRMVSLGKYYLGFFHIGIITRISRKDFARFKLAFFTVSIIPRIFITAQMSLITNPRTFLALTK
jgi:hypothetical protein